MNTEDFKCECAECYLCDECDAMYGGKNPPCTEVALQSASDNISSPKLPELEEVFNKIMIDYRKSSWLYPPTRNVIKWVLEFVAGKIGR